MVLIAIILLLNNIIWMVFFYLFSGEKKEVKPIVQTLIQPPEKKEIKPFQPSDEELTNVPLKEVAKSFK